MWKRSCDKRLMTVKRRLSNWAAVKLIQHFHEENGAIYTVCFKDRAVYSLHATGALVDGIIHSIQALVRRQELKTFNSYSIHYLQLYYVC